MFCKRAIVASMVFILVFAGLSALFAENKKQIDPKLAGLTIEGRMKTINNLVKEGKFEEAQKTSENLENWVKAQRPEVIDRYLKSVQKTQVEIQEKQGNYEAAAATAEKANKENKSEEMQKKIDSSKQNLAAQKESFTKQMELASKVEAKDKEIKDLVNKRDQAVKELSGKKQGDISKEKLAELQSLMKKTASELDAKEKERGALSSEFHSVHNKYKDVELSTEMYAKISDKVQSLTQNHAETRKLKTQINDRYAELTANANVAWTGFADRLAETYKMEKEMLDLQKKMKEFSGKEKLTSEEMKAFAALKKQYAQLKSDVDDKMDELAKTFEDAKTFDDLNAEQAARLKELYADVVKSRDYLEENEKKLEVTTKKVDHQYGDANGDGVVDQNDIAILQKLTNPTQMKTLKGTKVDLMAADVDGDGRVSQNDLRMVQEKVWGFKKTFPVDPRNIPGDMNGNGKLDREDAARIEDAMKNPKSIISSFKGVADMNGDGKVDEADKALFTKAQKAQEAKIAEGVKKFSDDLNSVKDTGGQEKEAGEKRQAPSSGNPFAKGKKNN